MKRLFWCVVTTLLLSLVFGVLISRTTHVKYLAEVAKTTSLNDSILTLQNKLVVYEDSLVKIRVVQDSLKNQTPLIIVKYEKTSDSIVSGSWDFNVRFLAEFLSKTDNLPRRHGSSNK